VSLSAEHDAGTLATIEDRLLAEIERALVVCQASTAPEGVPETGPPRAERRPSTGCATGRPAGRWLAGRFNVNGGTAWGRAPVKSAFQGIPDKKGSS